MSLTTEQGNGALGYISAEVAKALQNGTNCATTITTHKAFPDDVLIYNTPRKETEPCSKITREQVEECFNAADEIIKLREQIVTLQKQLENTETCGKLMDAWISEHGTLMPWGKAVELISTVMKYSEEERNRLLRLDYPDFPAQIAAKDKEIARLKTVPMKYRRMAFNAELQEQVSAKDKALKLAQETINTYARHYPNCNWQSLKPCNCGFEKALLTIQEAIK